MGSEKELLDSLLNLPEDAAVRARKSVKKAIMVAQALRHMDEIPPSSDEDLDEVEIRKREENEILKQLDKDAARASKLVDKLKKDGTGSVSLRS